LVGSISEGSAPVNEDGMGYVGTASDVKAAWIFDGVTGINGQNYLPGGSDAAWLVDKANAHLQELAALDLPLKDILARLVKALIGDWQDLAPGLDLPPDYDPPASCLILVKRYGDCWQSVRLGDSCLLTEQADGRHSFTVTSPNNEFDHWLSQAVKQKRAQGQHDIKALLAEFRPELIASRLARNSPDGYGILEARSVVLEYPEYKDLGQVKSILLCTDGFYRAVDHYHQFSDIQLLDACKTDGGVGAVMKKLREVEASDPDCSKYERFKPADDATAVMLRA
jgi:hypothetical protein